LLTFCTQPLFGSRCGNAAGSTARVLHQPYNGRITKCQSPRLYEYQHHIAGGFLTNAKASLSHNSFYISLNFIKFRQTMSHKQITKSNTRILLLRQFQLPVNPPSPPFLINRDTRCSQIHESLINDEDKLKCTDVIVPVLLTCSVLLTVHS